MTIFNSKIDFGQRIDFPHFIFSGGIIGFVLFRSFLRLDIFNEWSGLLIIGVAILIDTILLFANSLNGNLRIDKEGEELKVIISKSGVVNVSKDINEFYYWWGYNFEAHSEIARG
ncbi:MAG: hypothetical protein V3V14_10250 [Saprospiraceae bacterium]